MTSLLSNEQFQSLGAPELVYVREVTAKEVLAGTPVELVKGIEIDPESTLYAVHRADGARLAVLSDREAAFAAALAHELAPVSVH